MKTVSLVAAAAVLLVGGEGIMPLGVGAQVPPSALWQVRAVRRPCPRADSLFGRFWRSHASAIRVRYSTQEDSTTLRTPDRQVSWQQAGSSHLVGTEAVIRLPGQQPRSDSARIKMAFRFVDSIYRSAEQAHITLLIDDAAPTELPEPEVDYVAGPNPRDVRLVVTVLMTPEQSLALARLPRSVKGKMGPYDFFLYDWELWDINSIYRASFCGIE